MRRGSLETTSRLEEADVWQFRWSEKGSNGRRVYRKRVIGTVEEYPDADSARNAICGLISEVNWTNQRQPLSAMTVAQRHTRTRGGGTAARDGRRQVASPAMAGEADDRGGSQRAYRRAGCVRPRFRR
jgi:hypothetical protein